MSIRKFIPKLVLVTASLPAAWASSRPVPPAPRPPSTTRRSSLDQLCEARGGTPYSTPYSITRCQFARANKGFETEQAVCEGLADGEFILALSTQPHEPGVVGLFPDVAARVMSRPAGWSGCHTAPAGPPRSLGWRRDRGCGYWVVTPSSTTSIAGCGPGVSSR